jgi:hypothetical protein
MDELFGNLIYFIPIAIIIFRVISAAKGQQKKNQPPKQSSGEPVRRIQEEREKPKKEAAVRDFIPPQPGPVQTQVPSWPDTKKKPPVKKPKPAVKSQPVQPKQGEYKSLFPGAFPESVNRGASPAGQLAAALQEQATEAVTVTAVSVLPGVPAGLTPLQQAFVWSEILGASKSEQGF